jgi:two-component system sensor histidine kinase BarA
MINASDDTTPVGEYTRIISLAVHEMRTPASVIGGYLRMLLNDTGEPLEARQRRMLEEAEKACGRLVALLNELSDLGKLDAGVATIRHERFDIFELVRDVAANVHEAGDREVRLVPQGLSSGGVLDGDRARLRSSIEFVLRAVLREQPASTTVVVDAQRLVRDGRPTAHLVVAPEPDFARASASPVGRFDDQRGGLGLGLPIAHRVITRCGGQVWSPAPPDGTELPLGSRGAIVVSIPLLE